MHYLEPWRKLCGRLFEGIFLNQVLKAVGVDKHSCCDADARGQLLLLLPLPGRSGLDKMGDLAATNAQKNWKGDVVSISLHR